MHVTGRKARLKSGFYAVSTLTAPPKPIGSASAALFGRLRSGCPMPMCRQGGAPDAYLRTLKMILRTMPSPTIGA